MNLEDWIPSIVSTGAIGLLGIAVTAWIKANIERSIQYSFDEKIESLKSSIRQDEERLRSEIKLRDDQIAGLRNLAFSGLAARQVEVDKRRVEAVSRVWGHVVDLGQLKLAAEMAGVLNIPNIEAKKNTREWPKIEAFLEQIVKIGNLDNLKKVEAESDRYRPFLNPLSWALFSAYRTLLTVPAMIILALRAGGDTTLLKLDEVRDLVRKALPEYGQFIEDYPWGLSHLIGPLEEKLLNALRDDLAGVQIDEASVQQAAAISRAVDLAGPAPPIGARPI